MKQEVKSKKQDGGVTGNSAGPAFLQDKAERAGRACTSMHVRPTYFRRLCREMRAEGGIRTRAPETGLKHFECSLLDRLSTSANFLILPELHHHFKYFVDFVTAFCYHNTE